MRNCANLSIFVLLKSTCLIVLLCIGAMHASLAKPKSACIYSVLDAKLRSTVRASSRYTKQRLRLSRSAFRTIGTAFLLTVSIARVAMINELSGKALGFGFDGTSRSHDIRGLILFFS